MLGQEKFITITNHDRKIIVSFLKEYKATLEKVFDETKKQKPYQSQLLSLIAQNSVDLNKCIKNLEAL